MKRRYAVITFEPDGNIAVVGQARKPDLEQLQLAVGGYIETVPHFTKCEIRGVKYTRGTAYCDEESRIKGKPKNAVATIWWLNNLGRGPFRYDPVLHGTVIFYAVEPANG